MRRVAVACALVSALACGAAVAQDDAPAAGDQPQRDEAQNQSHDQAQRDQTDADRRAAMRAWLVRRMEESRAEQARLESALQDLDAGEPLQDLRRDLRRDDDDDDDRRRGRFGRRDRDHGDTSIEERIRLVTRFAREHFPEFAERLESERQRDPDAARRIAARFWPRVAELLELEDSQPELFAVEVEKLRSGQQLMATVHRARRARPLDEAARQHITQQLRKLSEQHFELRLEATRLRLESLRQSVRETERELEERRAERERSVEQQVQRLLRWIDREDSDRDGGRRDRHDRRDGDRGDG